MKYDIAICSGYFAPLGYHHCHMFEHASIISNSLVVIVNSDRQLIQKKGFAFQDEVERLKIIRSLKWVDFALIAEDDDQTVCKTLKKIRNLYALERTVFCNGGDRSQDEGPEDKVCHDLGIDVMKGVGGEKKVWSSSDVLQRYAKYILYNTEI